MVSVINGRESLLHKETAVHRLASVSRMQIASVLHHQLHQKLEFRDFTLSHHAQDSRGVGRHQTEAGQLPVLSPVSPLQSSHHREESLVCRLFRQVKLRPASGLTVQMESEFSSVQKQQLMEGSAAGKAQKHMHLTFRDLSVRL